MKFLPILLLSFVFTNAPAQQSEVLTLNDGSHLIMDKSIVMIKFLPNTPEANRSLALDQAYFLPLDQEKNKPQFNYAFAELKPGLSEATRLQVVAELSNHPDIAYASIMFQQAHGELCAPTNKLFVKLNSAYSIQQMWQFIATNYNGKLNGYTEEHFSSLLYKLEFNISNTIELFEIADALFSTGYFTYCEPNMLVITNKTTDDTYYDYQWAINNTGTGIQYNGTPGADLDAECAWEYTKGAGSKVAILDEGIDLTHDDLTANLLPGYDAVFFGGGDVDNSNGGYEPGSDDAHGTNCAGIVCAIADNGIGVTGVAPESNVIPVRIAYSNWWGWVLEYDWVIDAIEWSVDNADADILSNSYQLGAEPATIKDAIDYAINTGRGGLGAIFVAAAGNYNETTMVFPGKYDNSIGVAATSMCDERKSLTSCDGENFWGSNYGNKLDVSAPGVKIPSTDISGGAGYDGSDYYLEMNGTSAATPYVSGVMALILSLNPMLTYEEARLILETTCEKVGGYTYEEDPDHPSSTWVDELGYGRVNACLALASVSKADIVGSINGFDIDTIAPGEILSVDYLVHNNGFTDASTFDNLFLLSADCLIGDDVILETYNTVGLIVDETAEYTNTVTIPENTMGGDYQILLNADNGLMIDEASELNNVSCANIYIQCGYSPDDTEAIYGYHAQLDSLEIITTSGCDWEMTPAAPAWITIINGSATGSGYFVYTLEENPDLATRSFTFNYGPNEYTITQEKFGVGIEELIPSISIYPNPALDYLIIDSDLTNKFYSISNTIGEIIMSGQIAGVTSIDIHALPAGVYVLNMQVGGNQLRETFIKAN